MSDRLRPPLYSRRDLLRWAGAGAAAAGLPHWSWAEPGVAEKDAPAAAAKLRIHTTQPLNAEGKLPSLVASRITPLEHFYIRNNGNVPQLDAESFELSIEGLVNRPAKFRLDRLRNDLPATDVEATLTCAGNRREEHNAWKPTGGVPWSAGAIGNAMWRGVSLQTLLKLCEPKPEAKHVWFDGLDVITEKGKSHNFGGSIPLAKALGDSNAAPGALVTYDMNGKPLTPEHGSPLRMVVPGYVGARSVKWLGKIVVSDRPSPNPFVATSYKIVEKTTPEAWAAAEPIYEFPINAVICSPTASKTIVVTSGMKLQVKGYALPPGIAGRTIKAVEVSADGGRNWQAAKLNHEGREYCWQLWEAEMPVATSTKLLLVRATDSAGNRQPDQTPWNAKGYLYNAWHGVPVRAVSDGL